MTDIGCFAFIRFHEMKPDIIMIDDLFHFINPTMILLLYCHPL